MTIRQRKRSVAVYAAMSWAAHFWTVWPFVRHRWARPPESTAWSAEFVDPTTGPIRLTGHLSVPDEARALVVIAHGLGGSSRSYYARLAARAAHQRKMASLRLNLRGADLTGVDVYHGGLTLDLMETFDSSALDRFQDLYLLGYSMGGHVSLRYAADSPHPRLRAVAAICSPLDMATSSRAFDQNAHAIYRHAVMHGLRRMHRALARRTPLPVSIERMRRVNQILEWDEELIAPRFGFENAADYHERASAIGSLGQLDRPALLISSIADPIIDHATVLEASRRANDKLHVEPVAGGHCGFSPSLNLGFDPEPGLAHQALGWMERAGRANR